MTLNILATLLSLSLRIFYIRARPRLKTKKRISFFTRTQKKRTKRRSNNNNKKLRRNGRTRRRRFSPAPAIFSTRIILYGYKFFRVFPKSVFPMFKLSRGARCSVREARKKNGKTRERWTYSRKFVKKNAMRICIMM